MSKAARAYYNGGRIHWARFSGRYHACALSAGEWYGVAAGATPSEATRNAGSQYLGPRWWENANVPVIVFDRMTGEAVAAE